ncbi:MAG: hypothetical protein HY300_07915 [Verrucomicrobia bacterium]|nr:hypothetical protein [Verrucomicrobiota bacterium]
MPAPDVSPMAHSQAAVLTLGLQNYMARTGRAPKDLNELLAAKDIQNIPPPPPGTKYVINAKQRQVVLVKQ